MIYYAKILWICLSILLVEMNSILNAQKLTVLQIKGGEIQNISKKTNLILSSEISDTDLLRFKNQQARATLMDNQKKTLYELAPSNKSSTPKVKDLLLNQKDSPIWGGRGTTTSEINDLKAYLGKATFYILGNTLKIRLAQKYTEETRQYFILRNEKDGKSKVVKIPKLGKDTLVLSQTFLAPYLKSGKSIQIYWLDEVDKTASPIAQLQAEFVPEEELKGFFKGLKQVSAKDKFSYQQQLDFYLKYFTQLYGNTDHNILENWLKDNKFLKP